MKKKDLMSFLDRVSDRVPDSADDVLGAIGLQRRTSPAVIVLPAVGTLFLGAVIGAAIGMFFGPRYGGRIMDRIGVKIPESLREREGEMKRAGGNATSSLRANNVGQ
jgi:membrane protein DedA with SNARE-associated domain